MRSRERGKVAAPSRAETKREAGPADQIGGVGCLDAPRLESLSETSHEASQSVVEARGTHARTLRDSWDAQAALEALTEEVPVAFFELGEGVSESELDRCHDLPSLVIVREVIRARNTLDVGCVRGASNATSD